MPENKKTVLIIDDNAVIRKLASNLLSKKSYTVDVAASGLEGLEAARQAPPQVILLDVMMPEIDGYEVCKRLKADPATKDIPIIMVTSKTESIDKVMGLQIGAADYVTKPFDHAELEARVATQVKMKNLLDELEEKNALLEDLVKKDGLTGLFNHRYFHDCIADEFSRAVRYANPLSCLLIDIDHFKKINDTYGHQAGDEILQSLAHILRMSIRKTDMAARYGGEEFAIILPQTPLKHGYAFCERLRRRVENNIVTFEETPISITVSIGLASLREHQPGSCTELIKFADDALYTAKAGGRNRVHTYSTVDADACS